MFNETKRNHFIVHTFNVFKITILNQVMLLFNVFETKAVVKGQLICIQFID